MRWDRGRYQKVPQLAAAVQCALHVVVRSGKGIAHGTTLGQKSQGMISDEVLAAAKVERK